MRRFLTPRVEAVAAMTGIAGAMTAATGLGWLNESDLAASPSAIAKGRIWLLLTSGLIADRPWLASLIGFAIVALAALWAAPVRVVVASALAGHVLSTLAVYGLLGIARAVDHDAFAPLVHKPDVGLSAIIAAWIGVVSQALWDRFRSRRAHMLNAFGCIGCALIGFAFRPDLTALDSEHLVAFALGVAIAAWWPRRSPLDGVTVADVDRELEELLVGSSERAEP